MNLNRTLGNMLTKYLPRAATKIWAYSTSKYSPYYLLYGQHPHLPSDDNPLCPLEMIATTTTEYKERITNFRNARSIANEALLERAIKAKKIREERVGKGGQEPITVGQWILVRHEDKQKFKSRWYGPYKVFKHHILGTYLLEDPNRNILWGLINGNRLINARTPEGETPTTMWSSPKFQARLQKANVKPASAKIQIYLRHTMNWRRSPDESGVD